MSRVINLLIYTWWDKCPVWSLSSVINVIFYTRCDQCPVWSMSFFCDMVVLISIQKDIRIYSIWTNICIDNYMNILKYSKFCHTLCQMSVVDVSCRLQCSSSHSCASSWTSSFATARCKMHGARVNELVMCWYLRLIRIDQTKILKNLFYEKSFTKGWGVIKSWQSASGWRHQSYRSSIFTFPPRSIGS